MHFEQLHSASFGSFPARLLLSHLDRVHLFRGRERGRESRRESRQEEGRERVGVGESGSGKEGERKELSEHFIH